MSTAPATLRTVEVSGAEALCLLRRGRPGRLVYTQRYLTVLRPAAQVWADGRLLVRTCGPATDGPATATCEVEECRALPGTGWTVTVSGPAEVVTATADDAAADVVTATVDDATAAADAAVTDGTRQRAPGGWTPGPQDTILRIRPRAVTGFRVARGEA
ncbi:pyridoxamine 5'-phosphate oxidase family protein [Streptomyces panaciradicis]|uniref:pyridoxamine 5'-phosphate oxidase family protein n=1 Tax=Streptomyces panaciradicis TaxID=1470261 RepID=UPI00201CF0E9|nr:pyridoxamine 5'-phosphate oxidase family protein [Streptomyces panaciradicis]MCL6671455.1 pyridoxamine 5'-phosphate oxidase family protein [Streptomyces panaciradicis]